LKTAIDILQEKWGHNSFRPLQKKIIDTVLEKKDAVVVLPTGGGKSICYQIPILLQEGICIVISPLLALMEDQIRSLNQRKIKAVALNSVMTQNELIVLFDNIQYNGIKFLYLSPEKLQSKFIQEKIKQLNTSLVAIDEAHCISEWGHDFRPSYLKLTILKELCPNANTIALTASATEKVLEDVEKQLNLYEATLYKSSFKRDRLAYQVFEVEDKLYKLKQILKKINAPSIVYTNSRNDTKKISEYLNQNGYVSTYYHGGLSTFQKKEAYDSWYREKAPIMVATNAFGMGIDKATIRVVIHLNFPNSIENYLQEAGRSGRDGKKAFSVLLKTPNDALTAYKAIENENINLNFIKKVYFQINQYFQISKGERSEKLFDFNITDFCNSYNLPIKKTSKILKILTIQGIINFDENVEKRSYLKFICTSKSALDYAYRHPSDEKLLKTILRNYGGLFENFVTINEYHLSKKTGLSKNQLSKSLKKVQKDSIVKYYPAIENSSIRFLVPREDDKTINRVSKRILKHQKNKEIQAKKLLAFVENKSICRSKQLLAYFGEKQKINCGICDICIEKKNLQNTPSKTRKHLIELLSKNQELSSREICEQTEERETIILKTIQHLLEENKIRITKENRFTLK